MYVHVKDYKEEEFVVLILWQYVTIYKKIYLMKYILIQTIDLKLREDYNYLYIYTFYFDHTFSPIL